MTINLALTFEEEAEAIREKDPFYAKMLREVDYSEFSSEGVRPFGCTGYCLIGNIVPGDEGRREMTHLVTVTVGDLVDLIAVAAAQAVPGEDLNFRYEGQFRGREVVVVFLNKVLEVYKGLGRESTVSVKAFHNPATQEKPEHFFISVGTPKYQSQGVVLLDSLDHPTADLVTLPIVLLNGTRVS